MEYLIFIFFLVAYGLWAKYKNTIHFRKLVKDLKEKV